MKNSEGIIYEMPETKAKRLKDLGISEQQIAEILASIRMEQEKSAKFEKKEQEQEQSYNIYPNEQHHTR